MAQVQVLWNLEASVVVLMVPSSKPISFRDGRLHFTVEHDIPLATNWERCYPRVSIIASSTTTPYICSFATT